MGPRPGWRGPTHSGRQPEEEGHVPALEKPVSRHDAAGCAPRRRRSGGRPERGGELVPVVGRIDKIVTSDKLGRKDGTFRIVPGLAGQCRSFESVNYPGHFLRHQDYRVKLAPRANDEFFRRDAPFCVRTGLANSQARSFESFNFPGHCIPHTNFEVWIARADGTALFKKDATYFIAPALTTHGPSGIID